MMRAPIMRHQCLELQLNVHSFSISIAISISPIETGMKQHIREGQESHFTMYEEWARHGDRDLKPHWRRQTLNRANETSVLARRKTHSAGEAPANPVEVWRRRRSEAEKGGNLRWGVDVQCREWEKGCHQKKLWMEDLARHTCLQRSPSFWKIPILPYAVIHSFSLSHFSLFLFHIFSWVHSHPTTCVLCCNSPFLQRSLLFLFSNMGFFSSWILCLFMVLCF